MAYEIFKKGLNQKRYFNSWDAAKYNALDTELKTLIYKKYLMKSEVFTRDDFICQNKDCPFCKNVQYPEHLTVHHIRAKRNGGKDTARNGITLCRTSHQHYERAKGSITLFDNPKLPSHIRGHTFKLSKPIEINWKKVKVDMRIRRKELRDKWGIRLTGEQMAILMRFLRLTFDEFD